MKMTPAGRTAKCLQYETLLSQLLRQMVGEQRKNLRNVWDDDTSYLLQMLWFLFLLLILFLSLLLPLLLLLGPALLQLLQPALLLPTSDYVT